jgi:hypothetical protein
LKLWLILYVGQFIGATWGPLPYDMDECKRRAAEQTLKVNLMRQNPEIIAKMKAKGLDPEQLNSWRFECVQQGFRPFLSGA